jgi:hypothetical protein
LQIDSREMRQEVGMVEARRFVIQKVGDNYVPVPVHETGGADSMLYKVGGGAMALWGLRRGGFFGWIGALAGAALMYRGFTGRSLMCYFFTPKSSKARDGQPSQTPSYQNDATKRSTMLPADQVDEMVMESFPASDPPARHLGSGS